MNENCQIEITTRKINENIIFNLFESMFEIEVKKL